MSSINITTTAVDRLNGLRENPKTQPLRRPKKQTETQLGLSLITTPSSFAELKAQSKALDEAVAAATPVEVRVTDVISGTQSVRAGYDEEYVLDLAGAYRLAPANIPPLLVRADAGKYVVADGEYRLRAAMRAGLEFVWVLNIDCHPVTGFLGALRRNGRHGLKLTKPEILDAVVSFLRAAPGIMAALVAKKIPLRSLGDEIGVSKDTVARARDIVVGANSGEGGKSKANPAAKKAKAKAANGEDNLVDPGVPDPDFILYLARQFVTDAELLGGRLGIPPEKVYDKACELVRLQSEGTK